MPPVGESYRSRHVDDENSFEVFLEGWVIRQEQFLEELLVAQDTRSSSSFDEEGTVMRDLIGRVLAHYQEYYEEKSRITHRNVFQIFSPPWFSLLERAFLWIAGFKPGLAFTLVTDSVNDLSEDQVQMIKNLKEETKVQEKSLMEELARIQESVTALRLVELSRRTETQLLYTNSINNEEADENIERLKTEMENVVTDADRLRTTTADRIVGLLNPLQSLRFLTAAAQLQLRMRRMGMQIEAERQQNTNNEASNGCPKKKRRGIAKAMKARLSFRGKGAKVFW